MYEHKKTYNISEVEDQSKMYEGLKKVLNSSLFLFISFCFPFA